MPPTLILIRHAQALHNVADDWSIPDPALSDLGREQCAELQESLRNHPLAHKVELIVVSAMRRTLQTAELGLRWLWESKQDGGMGVMVRPEAEWQENADKPCDTGSPISQITKEFPQFDFSSVDPLYPDKTSNPETNPYAFHRRAILARGQTCLRELYSRPEMVIAVVSHSGFMRCAVCNRHFFNADWRIFDFDEEAMRDSKRKGEEWFILKEWPETEEKGGGLGKSMRGFFGETARDFPAEPQKFAKLGDETTTENPVKK